MSNRERRLLDKDIEIRKLQGELKHYKTCFFSCVLEKDRTKKQLEIAVDALKSATEYLGCQEPLVDVMAMNLHTDLSKALDQITAEQKDK